MTTFEPRVSSRLVVSGRFDPDELSKTIGLPPTEAWRADDPRTKFGASWGFDAWCLSSSIDSDLDWPQKIEVLLDAIEPVKEQFLNFVKSRNLEVEVQCIAFTDARVPVTWFSHSLLKRIVTLSADLDIDLYVLADDKN